MLKRIIAAAMSAAICAAGAAAAGSSSVPTVRPINASAASESHEAFIESIGGCAVSYYQQYKIMPSMTIAQAILESGWGTSDKAQYHNYFGMKARSGYTGPKKLFDTWEVVNGQVVPAQAYFMIFSSRQAGIKGYYDFINVQRYENLKNETDYKASCRKIQQDGWATAPNYADRLIAVIEENDLTRFDVAAGIGSGSFEPYTIRLEAGTRIYTTPESGVSNSQITVSTVYTIIEERTYNGRTYGKLKSGAGWVIIPAEYTFQEYQKSFPKGTKLYKAPGSGEVAMILTAAGTFTIVEEQTVSGVKFGKFKSGAGWAILN